MSSEYRRPEATLTFLAKRDRISIAARREIPPKSSAMSSRVTMVSRERRRVMDSGYLVFNTVGIVPIVAERVSLRKTNVNLTRERNGCSSRSGRGEVARLKAGEHRTNPPRLFFHDVKEAATPPGPHSSLGFELACSFGGSGASAKRPRAGASSARERTARSPRTSSGPLSFHHVPSVPTDQLPRRSASSCRDRCVFLVGGPGFFTLSMLCPGPIRLPGKCRVGLS